jgi:hypothetical protein
MLAWQRHSNLLAAAHATTKLAPLGLTIVPFDPNVVYSRIDEDPEIKQFIDGGIHHEVRREWITETEKDRLIEVVAMMEHHRWIAERLLMDWKFGDRPPKGSPENKRRIAFVDWDHLPESEAVKDRDQIARILELCRDEARRPREKCRFMITKMTG